MNQGCLGPLFRFSNLIVWLKELGKTSLQVYYKEYDKRYKQLNEETHRARLWGAIKSFSTLWAYRSPYTSTYAIPEALQTHILWKLLGGLVTSA